jgi:hypothetical protein
MKIKMLVPWQTYNPGDEIDPPGTMAELLVNRGFAKYAPSVVVSSRNLYQKSRRARQAPAATVQ